MALIRCSECGKEFSDELSACPNCACPIYEINRSIEKEKAEKYYQEACKKEIKKYLYIICCICEGINLLILLGIFESFSYTLYIFFISSIILIGITIFIEYKKVRIRKRIKATPQK